MARSKYGSRVEYSGPFFEKSPSKTFRQNARAALLVMAQDGADLVQSELASHRGEQAPHIADHIEGRVKSLQGKPWALSSVVSSQLHLMLPGHKGYALFLETGQRGQRQTSFRGLYAFRRVANAMKRSRKVVAADLTKGLN